MPTATQLDHKDYIPIAHPGDDVKALFKQYGAVRLHDFKFDTASFDKFVSEFNETTLTDYSVSTRQSLTPVRPMPDLAEVGARVCHV